ncbi:hypothetical protein [Kingella potus]|uniref:hypothetical protein n=1 Tax=Kingella potus TaxID=265175 RepID=UPI001FD12394|nr:hypothetical protein [Kingella potus]UOP01241.1 hypothetical protein LVJ84_02920 [Kingella potus]
MRGLRHTPYANLPCVGCVALRRRTRSRHSIQTVRKAQNRISDTPHPCFQTAPSAVLQPPPTHLKPRARLAPHTLREFAPCRMCRPKATHAAPLPNGTPPALKTKNACSACATHPTLTAKPRQTPCKQCTRSRHSAKAVAVLQPPHTSEAACAACATHPTRICLA